MSVLTCISEGAEDVELLLEVEGCLEILVLVEDGLRAGAMLIPLVLPELEAVAARARQRRPVGFQPAEQVPDLLKDSEGKMR